MHDSVRIGMEGGEECTYRWMEGGREGGREGPSTFYAAIIVASPVF